MGYTPEAARLDRVTDAVLGVSHTVAQVHAGRKRIRYPDPVDRPRLLDTVKPTDLEDVGSFFT